MEEGRGSLSLSLSHTLDEVSYNKTNNLSEVIPAPPLNSYIYICIFLFFFCCSLLPLGQSINHSLNSERKGSRIGFIGSPVGGFDYFGKGGKGGGGFLFFKEGKIA